MKRVLVCGIVACVALGWAWVAAAAQPSLQGGQALISLPEDSAVVRGTVPIVGIAVDSNFWKYEVYYSPQGTDHWFMIGTVHESQVANGLLETWETSIVPDGTYTLRLRLVNLTGNYQDVFATGILVANAVPTDTPEPTQTPAPTATQTPAATPTFIIPTSPLAQPTATPTLARPTRSALPDVLDINAWRQSLCLGAQLMAIVLVAIAVIFVLRRMI